MLASLVPRSLRFPQHVDRMQREMDNLMQRFLGPLDEEWRIVEIFSPRINVVEVDDSYEVSLELPGMKPEDFKLELKRNELWISGEKKREIEEKGKTFHRIEKHYGEFRRMIPLPGEVTEDKIEAVYRDGVLSVRVPKAEVVKPKAIEVKT
jgi:HSP20 family protein